MPLAVCVAAGRLMLPGLMVFSLTGCTRRPSKRVVSVPEVRVGRAERRLTPEEIAAARRITADNLYIIYSQKLFLGATPDQHFLDRPLMVLGVYNGLRRASPRETYLELRTHDRDAFAYAVSAAGAEPLLTTLTPGERVRLLCRGAGAVAGSPVLTDCEPARP